MPSAWRPKIAIALPYNGTWDPEWVVKTYAPLFLFALPWCDKVTLFCKVPSVGVARDTLVKNAMDIGCSHIFFIDTDNIFEQPADANLALNMLYQSMNNNNVKIVSGLYRAKQNSGFSWAMWKHVTMIDEKGNEKKGFVAIPQWTGNWIEVDVTGMGCTLIDLSIFKDLERPWFRWDEKDAMSEDFYFFKLAAKHGYKTWVYTDIRLSHLGKLKVKSDGTIIMPDM
jgi:hypothetical protein